MGSLARWAFLLKPNLEMIPMKSSSTRVFASIAALSAALLLTPTVAFAQHAASASGGGQRLIVTHDGAFVESAPGVTQASGGSTSMQPSGVIWTHPDGGLLWIGSAVSMGNHGSEVFTEYDLNNQRAELFSAFDTNPPTALWTDFSGVGATDHHAASADGSNVHISLHTFNQGQPTATCILSKFTSLSGTPDWTYTFPIAANGSNCAISRDGLTIVAVASDPTTSSVGIAVFSPATNVPVSYTTLPLGGATNGVRGFDLSADGKTLYLSAAGNPVNAYIFDVPLATVVFSTFIGASFDSHAISGDGSVFAFGNFGSMKVFERTGTTYTNTYTRSLGGPNYCANIDISDDSKTIAYGFTFYNTYQQVQVEALDVPTHTVTMTDIVSSTNPALQNIVSGVSISADGQRFGVGLWGDGSGPLAEVRLYAKNQNAPVGTLNLAGSVFGIAISADGQRVVTGSKSVHANALGNGGQIDLLGDGTPFTNYCFGNGSLVTPCPCGNFGMIGHGCENSSTTGGALLTANGTNSPDTVVLTSSSELATVLSIFLQGDLSAGNGIVFGDGLRCVSGTLKRIGVHNAVGGTVTYPQLGDLSISARSALLGDPISSGSSRYYQTYYRDPNLNFCPSPLGDSWNVSNGVAVLW